MHISRPKNEQDLFFQASIDLDYDIFQTVTTFNMLLREESNVEKMKVYSGSLEIPFIVDVDSVDPERAKTIEDLMRIRFYTHGKAGNYSEINDVDFNPSNQILPTKWYGRQEPFEFEFVVNAANGYQKIFDNIVIISNNAEPDSIECTIVGDGYDFNKEGIYNSENFGVTSEDKFDLEFKNSKYSQNFDIICSIGNQTNISFKTNILKDRVLNQYTLTSCSKLRDMSDPKYNRRLGNMTYLEDK